MADQARDEALASLIDALELLAAAQQGLEAEVALLRRVNSDTVTALQRLRRWKQSHESAGSSSASAVDNTRHQPRAADPARNRAASGPAAYSNAPGGVQAAARPASHTAQQQLQLPPDILRLQQLYNTMSQQVHDPASGASSASGGFLQSLNTLYGPGGVLGPQPQHQQQQQPQGAAAAQAISHCCSPNEFAEQARFVGLVAAVLSAVQELIAAVNGSTSPDGSASCMQLHSTVPSLLHQCEHWLQEHSSAQERQQQQQQSQQADACCWRNRFLRSICATGAAARHTGALTAAAASRAHFSSGCADMLAATAKPTGLWLPASCWGPLSSHSSAAAAQKSSPWQVLLPQHAPQQPAAAQGSSPVYSSQGNSQGAEASQPVLTYTHPSELIQHSRQVQKIQQLLLQLAVESRVAPQLLQLLLQGCQQLQVQKQGHQQSASLLTHERCCALYRLVYSLAAGPVKQRGLGTNCQVAAEAWDG